MLFEDRKVSAVVEFRQHMRKYLPQGKYIAVNLNLEIRRWLAHELRRNQFQLDQMAIHSQIELVKFIETSVRTAWQGKAKKTRATKAETKKIEQDKKRQLKFDF